MLSKLTPTRLAGKIGVAPQTVNRWLTAKVAPRPSQVIKLQAVAREIQSSVSNDMVGFNKPTGGLSSLGARSVDYVMAVETEAKSVWIVKNGTLREASRGFIGEQVLQALQNGVQFNYVFFRDTPAAESFERLRTWVGKEEFVGSVTG